MIIKTLVENTTTSKDYNCVHGLSFYIETEKHKVLFDLGPGKLFLENAHKMNVNMEDIDTVVISHGHYDHGGALKTFLEHNKKAKIYIREDAFEPYYTSLLGLKIYIGLDKELQGNQRIVFTKGYLKLDEEFQIFSDIKEHKFSPDINNKLYKKVGKKYEKDSFEHEQSILINENNTYTLIAGCAHNGIYNIIEKAEAITGVEIKHVISGFHLFHLPLKKVKNLNYLHELAQALKTKKTIYYTCHCTGQKTFDLLQKDMGEQIKYLSTGSVIELY